jgi:glycosyltransferase involved in cell wall biosynthesis
MVKPLVLIPSYNSGQLLESTVRGALEVTQCPVWVVIDGSDDGSEQGLLKLEPLEHRLKVIIKPRNEGKGAAVRSGLEVAAKEAYTHALVMDADGQHPAAEITTFLKCCENFPEAMILGQPVFGEDVPWERLYGRKLSVWMVCLETFSRGIGDPLFGFRVYPIHPLLKVMSKPGRSNRYDFDPEVAVRLYWEGVPAVKINAPVAYIDKEQGGVSHFHYFRDNFRFIALHVRLIIEAPFHGIARLFKKPQRH